MNLKDGICIPQYLRGSESSESERIDYLLSTMSVTGPSLIKETSIMF
jgi:hypothetical protein